MTSNRNIRQLNDIVEEAKRKGQTIDIEAVHSDPERKRAIKDKAKILFSESPRSRSGLKGEIDVVLAKIDRVQYSIDEFKSKKAGTKAHAKIAQLEVQLNKVVDRLNAIEGRSDHLGGNMGQTQAAVFSGEVDRLKRRIDSLWGDLSREFYELKDKVDLLAESHEKTSSTVDDIQYAMDSEETIVDIDKNENEGPLGLAILIGIVAGILAGFIANNIFDDWDASRTIVFGALLGIAAALFVSSIKSGETIAVGKIRWAERKPTIEPEPSADSSEPIALPPAKVVLSSDQEEVRA